MAYSITTNDHDDSTDEEAILEGTDRRNESNDESKSDDTEERTIERTESSSVNEIVMSEDSAEETDAEEESRFTEDETEETADEIVGSEGKSISENSLLSKIGNAETLKGFGLGLLVAAMIVVFFAVILRRSKKQASSLKSPGMPMEITMYSGRCLTDPGKLELRDGLLLGSSKKCDVRFEGDGVEPEHARIVIQNGQAYIEDIESKNGVIIGGMRIQDRNPLRNGYVIGLGEVEFLVKY
ncbi:MAG: FHA domain-containing protein [Lachnospiraceae bacterium]|nr:FHA domain-containing protein [Lachnospiraceae bacterium]